MDQQLGMRIRQLRKERGWTQAELAGKSGLSASVISRIENGKERLSLAKVDAVANAMNVTASQLFACQVDAEGMRPGLLRESGQVEEFLRRLDYLRDGGPSTVEEVQALYAKCRMVTEEEVAKWRRRITTAPRPDDDIEETEDEARSRIFVCMFALALLGRMDFDSLREDEEINYDEAICKARGLDYVPMTRQQKAERRKGMRIFVNL